MGVLHSNYYADLFNEKVVVILKIQERIIYEAVLDIDKRITTHEFKHMVRQVGHFKFDAELVPYNYKGFDQIVPFEIEVKPSSEDRVVSFIFNFRNLLKASKKEKLRS